MVSASLHDNRIRPDRDLRPIIQLQLYFSCQNNTVINAIGSVKWRGPTGQKIDNPQNRPLIERQS